MVNVKLFNKISTAGTHLLDSQKYNVSEDHKDYQAVLVRSAKLHDVTFPNNLLCIARAGAGVNNIPVDECTKRGIVVFNTPGANANAVKEIVICSLLMSSRRIVDGIEWTKTLAGNGDNITPMVEKGKSAFVGPELEGKKIGIIGLGAIGIMVANAAMSLGMEVYGYDPYLSIESAWKISRDTRHANNLDQIFRNCDYITMHIPLTDVTRTMINKDTIAAMKQGVRILNFSRGELVCEDDMADALDKAHVACYVTDFPSEKMLKSTNVIALPHLGASTPESEDNCAKMAALQTIDFIENGNIKNSVNFPHIAMPRESLTRLCIVNKNIPNVVGKISTFLADNGVNIENMANRSKDDFAYTIVETNSNMRQDSIDKISALDEIVSIRVITNNA